METKDESRAVVVRQNQQKTTSSADFELDTAMMTRDDAINYFVV
jgi:hypothetical protein